MTWAVRIPYAARSDSLADVADAARALPPQERDVTRALVLGAMTSGRAQTAGGLLDLLDAATPAERRRLLDDARKTAGLPSTARADADAAHAARSRAFDQMPSSAEGPSVCAHPACLAVAVNASGAPTAVDVARWWCPEHVDQASPGDLSPAPGLHWGPNGIVDEREQAMDRERDEREAERVRVLREQRAAERDAATPAVDRHNAGLGEYFRPANLMEPQ